MINIDGVWFSGHFKPSLSKIGQKMAKFYNFEKKIIEKKFSGSREFPGTEKWGSNFEK